MNKIVAYVYSSGIGYTYFTTAGKNPKTFKPFATCSEFKAFLAVKYPEYKFKVCREKV